MGNNTKQFLTTPVAVLIGAAMITAALLVNGGVIKFKGAQTTTTAGQQAPVPPGTGQAVQGAQANITIGAIKEAFNNSQIKFGDSNKKLIALEMADPSCPYCHIAAGRNPELNKQAGARFTLASDGGSYIAPVPELEKLAKEGKTAFAYIYFPGHGNGEMGAKAMYCAFEKNKFWEVHDLLMGSKGYDMLNNTVKNDKSKSSELANFLGTVIDPNFLKQCLESGKYDNRLQQDIALGTSLSVSGTPGFFLNTTRFDGAYSYKDMEATVKSLLGS